MRVWNRPGWVLSPGSPTLALWLRLGGYLPSRPPRICLWPEGWIKSPSGVERDARRQWHWGKCPTAGPSSLGDWRRAASLKPCPFLLEAPRQSREAGRVLKEGAPCPPVGSAYSSSEPLLRARGLADVTPAGLMSGAFLASLSWGATPLPLNSSENEANCFTNPLSKPERAQQCRFPGPAPHLNPNPGPGPRDLHLLSLPP